MMEVPKVSSDAELMWNILPAVAMPSHSKFLTARDRNGNVMVFGIGTDHVFRVAQEDPRTRLRSLVELNKVLGLDAKAQVLAFDLAQAVDGHIYLSFATNLDSQHALYVVEPFNPSEKDFCDETTRLKTVESERLDNMVVKDILLGELSSGAAFPAVILNYTNTTRKSANLKRFEVADDDYETLETKGDLSLPVSCDDVLCFSTGKIKKHEGVFALYKQGNSKGLIFSSWSDQFDSTMICPPGASFLSTFRNSKGDTDLIVGGDGIWHFQSRSVLTRDAQATAICEGEYFQGIYDMHIAQCASKVCVWSTTSSEGVSYVEFTTESVLDPSIDPIRRGVPLIPSGQGGGIAGFVGLHGENALLVANRKNEMTYLQQSLDNREWERTPFWFPSTEETISIYCYVTRIAITDASGKALPNAIVTLSSTGAADVIINGLPYNLSTSASPIETDEDGSITIVNPTTDISTYQFLVHGVSSAQKEEFSFAKCPLTINPMAKVEVALSAMTEDKLAKATLSDGTLVFKDSTPEELKEAAEALNHIDEANQSLITALAGSSSTLLEVQKMSVASVSNSIVDNIVNVFWDFWHFVESSWKKVKSWAVESYNGIKAFVINLGNKIYRFVLDTADRIAKAASFIYTNYLKAPLEKMIDWFRNLFNWGDIVQTQKEIVTFLNTTLDFVEKNVSWSADKVDTSFDGWKTILKDQLSPKSIPASMLAKHTGPQIDNKASADQKEKMASSDVKQNWLKYQLSHGGALKGASIVENGTGEAVADEFQKTWEDIIKPTFDSLKETVDAVSEDLMLLFAEGNTDFTVSDVLRKLGVDVLVGLFDAIKQILKGLLVRLAHMVRDVKGLLNKQIKVPIFSDLWVYANKVFNKDVAAPTFSIMGFVGFLLAIPIVTMSKLFTGAKPRPLPPVNILSLEKFFHGNASVDDTKSFNHMCGMIEVASAATLSIVGLTSVVGVGALLAKLLDFTVIFGAVRLAACWPSRRDLPAWELRRGIWVADAVIVGVTFISRKVDKGGQGEKVLAVIEAAAAVVNIGMHTAANAYEMSEDWADKDEERTGYQILISVLGGVSTVGKDVAIVSQEPYTKLGGAVAKQVAGKAAGFFNVINTYSNITKGKYVAVLNSGS